MATSGVDFESSLLQVLSSDEKLKSIVGDKIYMMKVPLGVKLPIIVCYRISGNPANTISGYSGLEEIDLQIDCLAMTYKEVKDIAKAVRKAMPCTGAEWGAHLDHDQDLYNKESNAFRITMRYTVWYLEKE